MTIFSALGAGNMANAILSGAVASGCLKPQDIGTYNVHEEKRRAMAEKGYVVYATIPELCRNSQYILLSMKPQQAEEVLLAMKPVISPEKVVISIAAGISQGYIQSILGAEVKVVLVMPNTPLLVGCGATAIARCAPTTPEEFDYVKGIFASAGMVREIPGDKMNEIIAVSGSTPAYLYRIAQCFCDYAAAHGIDRDTANALFCQTMIGSARMMTETGKTQQELIDMVTSPKGTTLMGLEALEKGGLPELIQSCCDATIKRARELGR
jgi:pyrroline-5-carboxylate reductase